MFEDFESPFLVPCDGSFRIDEVSTQPPDGAGDKKTNKKLLRQVIEETRELQRMFYAHDRHALLLVFQAMDAAGKDSTISAVMSGINPAGCQVYAFKRPSAEELDHDFLWRSARCLPERGRIGIFNRSYYEEVLVVRVHPGILDHQQLPYEVDHDTIWRQRYDSIRDHELHLARNGTLVLKFFLNVSQEAQKARLLRRIDDPNRHWKFEAGDLRERARWPDYMAAYEDALNATSRAHAPWFSIPADNKRYMQLQVATIVRDTLCRLGLSYPTVSKDGVAELMSLRDQLAQS